MSVMLSWATTWSFSHRRYPEIPVHRVIGIVGKLRLDKPCTSHLNLTPAYSRVSYKVQLSCSWLHSTCLLKTLGGNCTDLLCYLLICFIVAMEEVLVFFFFIPELLLFQLIPVVFCVSNMNHCEESVSFMDDLPVSIKQLLYDPPNASFFCQAEQVSSHRSSSPVCDHPDSSKSSGAPLMMTSLLQIYPMWKISCEETICFPKHSRIVLVVVGDCIKQWLHKSINASRYQLHSDTTEILILKNQSWSPKERHN